jgi:Spy/CpxP family protein refolding chaperone
MKTRLLVMVGMIISTAIFAQNATRDSRKPVSGYERMKRELALTDKQYASVKDIDTKYAKKRSDEFEKFERKRFEERETMRSLRFEREREMRKVLTPAQNKKWNDYRAMKKNEKHFRKGKRDGHQHKHFRKNGHDRRGSRHDMERKG